jgi:DNA (cytosine-5)-methyltransferase 1
MSNVKFIDLFAGIGGFHIALSDLGAECVFASEIDEFARQTYLLNHSSSCPVLRSSEGFAKDITEVEYASLPDFDVLCAGFPCQPFSQVGKGLGFADTRNNNRGNLFFEILEILQTKRPAAFFLENVRHIKNHDNGETFRVIQDSLESIGYSFHWKVVKASDHGLPQHRPRVFMVGFRDEKTELSDFEFPDREPLSLTMSDVLGGDCPRDVGFTLRVGGRGSAITDRRNWDSYLLNGETVRIDSLHGLRMMGFPEDFEFPVSETQAMKQLGNSVAVPAIRATAKNLIEYLKNLKTVSDEVLDLL